MHKTRHLFAIAASLALTAVTAPTWAGTTRDLATVAAAPETMKPGQYVWDDAQPASAEPRTATARPRAANSPPRQQYQILQAVYTNGQPVCDAPIASERPCSLFELSKQRCRWPISTPGAEDFCFCGNMPLDGLPYCAGHTRLAYRSGARVARG